MQDYNKITVDNCEELFLEYGECVILNDGKVLGFEPELDIIYGGAKE